MANSADIIIIGGGIAGLGLAAHLSKETDVILLEQEDSLGYHSSGRSAAIFIKNYGNDILKNLNGAAETFFLSPEGISDHSLLSPRGEILLANEEELQDLEDYVAAASDMDRLNAKEAIELVPILREEMIAGAAIERGAQDIDSDLLLQGYTGIARQQGTEIITKAEVTSLSRANNIWQISSKAGDFEAPIIVNAAGGWADLIAEMAGLSKIGLVAKRRSIAVTPGIEGYDSDTWPVFASASENWYAKPHSGKLYISPADEDPVEPHDVWADDMVLAEGLYRYEQMVTVPVTQVEHSWAGLRNFVADKTPVVGFDPRCEGFFWLAGQGGYGIQTAPALSGIASRLILKQDQTMPDRVIDALKPDRLL